MQRNMLSFNRLFVRVLPEAAECPGWLPDCCCFANNLGGSPRPLPINTATEMPVHLTLRLGGRCAARSSDRCSTAAF
ncbi:hypothetical protein AAFF_G00217710 [Aldrovandia affinis]|uniref:Uncharacterized protein n=1 Tax=Aldrovandia affinis TaxID=143900 RepID=A0AAD7SVS2_9TELE|nr:hypothetical protein AAFF_G00217710 [Aldrovandia affinis]